MNISKKDKKVLSILFIVMIIIVFVMFLIVPAFDELKEKQGIYDTLKKEVDEIKRKYNNPNNKPETINAKLETMIMDYYKNLPSDLVVDKIAPEVSFISLLNEIVPEDIGLTSTTAVEKKELTEQLTVEGHVDPISVSCLEFSKLYNMSLPATNYDLTELTYLLDALNAEERLFYKDFKIEFSKETQKYNGSIRLYNYYIVEPEKLPLPLVSIGTDMSTAPDAPEIFNIDKEKKIIKFSNYLSNVKFFEIYKVNTTEIEGKEKNVFNLVETNIKADQAAFEIEYYYGDNSQIKEGEKYVITACGNYKDKTAIENGDKLYYRTILTDDLVREKSFNL